MAPQRLDQALVTRGLVESRTKARRHIDSGDVIVSGTVARKPSQSISGEDTLEIIGVETFVGRGAHKLQAALDEWNLDVTGATAVDMGASTGGFTQVLLAAGAAHVVAIDVGHDQLHPSLRGDPRVTLCEGVNARYLTAQWWEETRSGAVHWVVADLSFISLSLIFEPVQAALRPASWVCLIKPQFEVGRGALHEGLARDPDSHERAITDVLASARRSGLECAGLMRSPITGEAGNSEYLCWLRPAPAPNQGQWVQRIHEVSHS